MNLAFSHEYWEFRLSSQLTNSIIFQRGKLVNQPGRIPIPPRGIWRLFEISKVRHITTRGIPRNTNLESRCDNFYRHPSVWWQLPWGILNTIKNPSFFWRRSVRQKRGWIWWIQKNCVTALLWGSLHPSWSGFANSFSTTRSMSMSIAGDN